MNSRPTAPAALSTRGWLLLLIVTLAITAGLSAVWAGVAALSGSNASWMAVVAALDSALLLRLAGHPPGRRRAALGVVITAATIACSAIMVAAAKIGMVVGMKPMAALSRISPEMVPLWLGGQVGWMDALWVASGILIAWFSAR
ncbi:hypothetical protein [Pseudomarimonas salicorniae]|uniref:Uncharacterized protein n=1 Tax=Pseudomarimonas salicorniae TaxID=2933270 RepID=A0ABT0GII0_9GAMM|nr:hypothetical protein [Lysobacter sp. CAU 1642]MCK7594353.1 hypothetical protein [Lysobacter sp. CAU 1642]